MHLDRYICKAHASSVHVTRALALAQKAPVHSALVHVCIMRVVCVGAGVRAWTCGRVIGIFVFDLRSHTAAARGLPLSLGGSTP